jgi:outer membrane protein assembly factor BamB
MADTVLIDLDADPWVEEPVRPARRRVPRRLPAVLLAVLAVVLLGGREPVRPAFLPVAELPVAGLAGADVGLLAFGPDTVYLADRTGPATAVTAYAVGGGARRWRTVLPGSVQYVSYQPRSGVVFAELFEGTAEDGTEADDRITALDARTGATLWSGRYAQVLHPPSADLPGLLLRTGDTLRWVDPRTGGTVWSRRLAGPSTVQFLVGPPVRVAVMSGDGNTELLAVPTGAVLASGWLPPSSDVVTAELQLLGGRLYEMYEPQPGSPVLAVFDPATFRPLWTLDGDYYGFPVPCGALVCVSGTAFLTAVDPATGRIAWQTMWSQVPVPIDGHRLIGIPHQPGSPMAVLDAATGRVRLTLKDWTPVYPDGPVGTVLLVRPDQHAYGTAWFAVVDPDRDARTLLGALSDIGAPHCRAGATLLACTTPRHTVRIWRYRTR